MEFFLAKVGILVQKLTSFFQDKIGSSRYYFSVSLLSLVDKMSDFCLSGVIYMISGNRSMT